MNTKDKIKRSFGKKDATIEMASTLGSREWICLIRERITVKQCKQLISAIDDTLCDETGADRWWMA